LDDYRFSDLTGAIRDPYFWRDIARNVPGALAGSFSGTLGMPVDMVMAMSGNKLSMKDLQQYGAMPGSSQWFGKLMGADINSPQFNIANQASMAPPIAGAIGAIGKYGKYIPGLLKGEEMGWVQQIKMSGNAESKQFLQQAMQHARDGKHEQAADFIEKAWNSFQSGLK
jgi:hypothetical protein